MSRQRVSKGSVFQKSDEKIIQVLKEAGKGAPDDVLIDVFIKIFLDDWRKIIKRYDEHERLTRPGKSHPMAPPRKYLINKFRKHRLAFEGGADLDAALAEIQSPTPKFVDGVPPNLEELLSGVQDVTSYEARLKAVFALGKFQRAQSIEILTRVAENDRIFDVRKAAYDRLVRFGCAAKAPTKEKRYSDPKIHNKFLEARSLANPNSSAERVLRKFKSIYPEEYDIYHYQMKSRLLRWAENMVKNLPKA